MNKRLYILIPTLLAALWLGNPSRAYSTQQLAPDAPLGPGFTYQGFLKDSSGAPVNSICDFIFRLWDDPTAGAQIGANSRVDGIIVSYGYFSSLVNGGGEFGAQPFDNSQARWLEVRVRCRGEATFTTLSPRQPVSWNPPTHDHWGQSWSGNSGTGLEISGGDVGLVSSGVVFGVIGESSATTDTSYGVLGQSNSDGGRGVFGLSNATTGSGQGVFGRSNSDEGIGVLGWAPNTSGRNYGVFGQSNSTDGYAGYFNGEGYGVYSISSASSGQTYGVYGSSDSDAGIGVYGKAWAFTGETWGVVGENRSTSGYGVFGTAPVSGTVGIATNTTGITNGVYGESSSTSGRGVYGSNLATTGLNFGVYGDTYSLNGRGVYGSALTTTGQNFGVYGLSLSTSGYGVYGWAAATTGNNVGVYGQSNSSSGFGLWGVATASSGLNYGVYGRTFSPSGFAGYFFGDVHVTGDLSASGAKPFKIDHPLDPANQYLYHYSVESPEVLNQYTGNVTLDGNGEAWVELPAWFEALNTDFRYQLTPIGGFAPLYVAQKIQDNRFLIAGGEPGMEVSWLVTALRNDPYLQQNPQPVEQPKSPEQQGLYLQPELYGQPAEQGIGHMPAPEAPTQPE